MSDADRLDASEKQIQILGDAVAGVFDQLVKGNWIDDHGHPVVQNIAMIELANAMESTIKMRANILGYVGGGQFL